MDNHEKLATLGTQDTGRWQTTQITQHRKLKRWATRTPPTNLGWTKVTKGKPFLLLIGHTPCYSYAIYPDLALITIITYASNKEKGR